MTIKEIDSKTFEQNRQNDKWLIFKEGVQKIIDNKIEYCELIDYPYAMTTAVQDVMFKVGKVLNQLFYKATEKNLDYPIDKLFQMRKVKDDNNKYHIYCHFDAGKWDELIRKAKDEQNN